MHYCFGFFYEVFFLIFGSILFVISKVTMSYGGDDLGAALEVGDNFTFNANERNDEGTSFWLILCIEPLLKVKAPFIDNQGSSYEEGDDVVKGLYYQKQGSSDNSYVLLKDSYKVYVYSHLVKVMKFTMLLGITK